MNANIATQMLQFQINYKVFLKPAVFTNQKNLTFIKQAKDTSLKFKLKKNLVSLISDEIKIKGFAIHLIFLLLPNTN